jgi:hypothetical protein
MKRFFTKALLLAATSLFIAGSIYAQQPALVITRILANTSSNKEFVELLATRDINFTTEPLSVFTCNVGGSTNVTNGWVTGGSVTTSFNLNTGSVTKGQLLYVGGNNISLNGSNCTKYQSNVADVFGNGGSHADGVAVFNMAASSVTASTVPVEGIFYGNAMGNAAFVSGNSNRTGFRLPVNDAYPGGGLTASGTPPAPDPGSGDYIKGTGGVHDTVNHNWITARTWSIDQNTPNCGNTPLVTLSAANNLSLTVNTSLTTSFLSLPNVSGVISDPTDPAATLGLKFDVKENGTAIAAANYTFTAASSNTSVVPNANITITKADGLATVKIAPAGIGYATITLTLTKGGNTKTYTVNYAASAASANPAQTVFHSGFSDGSAAIALDNNYMVVGDDENNKLLVYDRNNSGLPVTSFDYSGVSGLHLTDLSGGVPREIDVEAVVKSINTSGRSYWLGSMSNQSTGNFSARPNRNRLFATDITGTGAATTISYVGDYENLRDQLTSWGTTNNLGLSASAASGQDPKQIDGFNVEGMTFAPDNTTLYIGFRAPLQPTTNRVNALIAPIQNFETWFGSGTTSAPTFGSPILLNLGGRGIRDMYRMSSNSYIIIAGDYDDAGNLASAVYRWNGNANDAPTLVSGYDVSALNPEAILPLYSGSTLLTNQLQLVSDNGGVVFYNDGTAAKDLSTNAFKKFRSDFLTNTAVPLPVIFSSFTAQRIDAQQVQLQWNVPASAGAVSYSIERSTDGASFENIANIKADNGRTVYYFTDENAGASLLFYRIKSTTAAGETNYTNMLMVKQQNDFAYSSSVYPNPAGDNIVLTSNAPGTKQYELINPQGKRTAAGHFTGNNIGISTAALQPGLYFVHITGEGYSAYLQLVKQ